MTLFYFSGAVRLIRRWHKLAADELPAFGRGSSLPLFVGSHFSHSYYPPLTPPPSLTLMSRSASVNPNRSKIIALWVVGALTTLYVVVELGFAVWLKSLVLLSDGFHNLSDVVSIGIAYWSIVVRGLTIDFDR